MVAHNGDRALGTDGAFASWLGRTLDTAVSVVRVERLSGGAIQQNWLVDAVIDGRRRELVVRTEAPSTLPMSHSRAHEFAILQVAFRSGVAVPEPLWLCDDASVIGAPFFVMQRTYGVGTPSRVIQDVALGGERASLAERLGAELARIHEIRPPRAELSFLSTPRVSAALDAVASNRSALDVLQASRPVIEWALRWLEFHAPAPGGLVLCHRDFRTGNYLLNERGVAAILDWEFAGWGEAAEDIAWFCAACWRFGAFDREAGGIGERAAFYRGYERVAEVMIDPAAVHYWEVAAHVRWAVVALMQAQRHVSGAESSLELALTSHIVPELEHELLALTRDGR